MEKHKYLDSKVASQYVFLLTDCNRQTFWVGMAEHWEEVKLSCAMFKQQQTLHLKKQPRLVYYERVSPEGVFNRYRQLQYFTHSQKARLIRAVNPDWQDLHPDLLSDTTSRGQSSNQRFRI